MLTARLLDPELHDLCSSDSLLLVGEMNRTHLVLFGMHNGTFGPYCLRACSSGQHGRLRLRCLPLLFRDRDTPFRQPCCQRGCVDVHGAAGGLGGQD
jgi:hypothetical protein